jgi:hypothetical protein
MRYTTKTEAAIRRYTLEGCQHAHFLNSMRGEGAASIALSHNIPNVNTTGAADAAINAGREIAAAAMAEEAAAAAHEARANRA